MPDLNRVLRKITRVTPSVFLLVLLWLVFTGSRDLRHKSVSGSGTEGTNWPFFRGEGSRGIAAGSEYPTDWNGTTGKNIEWKIIIPGVCFFIVVAGSIFTASPNHWPNYIQPDLEFPKKP